ncbi:MAG: choice-of-anchor I family protein [Acidobacteria bacterium]|nr:choice-of-anchor I family protein [Acidobacteriota bacterium]
MAGLCLATFAADNLNLQVLGTYKTGVFDDGASEIGAYDPTTQQLFVVNGHTGAIDVLYIGNPSAPVLAFSIDVSPYGNQANSVAIHNGIVAAAVEANVKQDPGKAVFFNTAGQFLNQVTVGALPDMIIFTPDGTRVLVANEGEPKDDVTVDPEGSISIINLSAGVGAATVTTASFTAFNGQTLDPSIRVFTPGATVAQDMEPEYIAVSPDSSTAWVTCQENNALAVVNIASATVTQLIGLGFKDHSLAGNELDASDKDMAINIANWPVFGMYLPDSIDVFTVGGTTYLITANEGDSRDYSGYSEEARVKDVTLDPTVFPNAATLQMNANLGRLKITTSMGDDDTDGDYDRLFSYGARSFSILNAATGSQVFDSGSMLEQTLATLEPANFNSTNDENGSFDSRSDDKGPEPEGLAIGTIGASTYAFIGLERIGGIMVFDISVPTAPVFVTYINNRDFAGDPTMDTAGDLAPEGLAFIPANESPNHHPLLAVMNEVSGSTTLYQINFDCQDGQILEVGPVGGSGILVSGTYGCTYEVILTEPDGTQTTYYVEPGPGGTAYLDVPITADLTITIGTVGGAPSDSAATVPTLGTWGLTVLAFGLVVLSLRNRRRVI